MAEPYLSQIEAFAFNFAPRGWAMCAGQTLPINQNQALFALLGTTYGGNGTTTFNLPDLRGRLAVGFGQGQGLSSYELGEVSGQDNVTLTMAQMPPGPHTHAVNANNATSGGTNTPATNTVLAAGYTTTSPATPVNIYSAATPSASMGSLVPVGGQPHDNHMPYLALNYCIALQGVFPTRG
jgi:microcystin-dependent protein